MSALRKSSSLETSRAPHVCALVCREVLAPGDHFHAEGEPDSRNLRANVAEAENAKRLAVETVAHRELPAAGAQMCVFQGDLTHAAQG